jgi:hypothetical protein
MSAADSNAHAAPSPYDSVRVSELDLQEFLTDYRQLLAAVRLATTSQDSSPVRTMHRALDALDVIATFIASNPACLEYLDYDRLAIREIHHFLPQRERTLLGWLKDYDLSSTPR